MSATHERVKLILAPIRPTYHQRHLVFSRNGGFDAQASVQQAVTLFHTIITFHEQILATPSPTIADDFEPTCQSLLLKMQTGNRLVFTKSVTELNKLLQNQIAMPTSGTDVNLSNVSPRNREVIEILNKQVDIILDKREELIDNGDPFNDSDFQTANGALIFSREVYCEQLRTHTVMASPDDIFDCKESNSSIQNAVGQTFVSTIQAADSLIVSKIKPSLV